MGVPNFFHSHMMENEVNEPHDVSDTSELLKEEYGKASTWADHGTKQMMTPKKGLHAGKQVLHFQCNPRILEIVPNCWSKKRLH